MGHIRAPRNSLSGNFLLELPQYIPRHIPQPKPWHPLKAPIDFCNSNLTGLFIPGTRFIFVQVLIPITAINCLAISPITK